MSKKLKDNESRREYTDGEQQESFIERRQRAFAERSRDPGDGCTWAVVLGSFMWTLLIICFAVAEQPILSLASFILAIVWIILLGEYGRVNVASILWGSSARDFDREPVEVVVFQSTLVVALISLVSVIVDVFRGWAFGWYGVALIATIIVYLVIHVRVWFQPVR